jgi:Tfp pilus assembly pilus retraction ATPase PilT
MAGLPLERLLETCVRNNATDMRLVPDAPPQIRTTQGWRALSIPPATAADIALLAEDILTRAPSCLQGNGYTYLDFWYGDVAYFRAMAYGHPDTTALVLMRLVPPSEPPPTSPASRRF